MLSQRYQLSLIILSAILVGMFGIFVVRELFPEYKIYQDAYVALEDLRAERTGIAPAPFKAEVKQIVIPADDLGPETIDRCVSCHVAMKLSHFSPTVIASDLNGRPIYDANGQPLQIPNDDYVWADLERRIEALKADGDDAGAAGLESLKHVEVGHAHYDMTKVLAMHPLIGRETIPFEFHPMEEFGCTSCHSGNGRGLVTDRAHGPVFDGQYHEAHMGHEPEFVEQDPDNDPAFARVFNHKPGHRLLFQTEPLLVGSLMQAKCVQCHQSSKQDVVGAASALEGISRRKERQLSAMKDGIAADQAALVALIELRNDVARDGLEQTISKLRASTTDYKLPPVRRQELDAQATYLSRLGDAESFEVQLRTDIKRILGSESMAAEILSASEVDDVALLVSRFLEEQQGESEENSIFSKLESVQETEGALRRFSSAVSPIERVSGDRELAIAVSSDTDALTHSYQRGEDLFKASACYACHKISGYSRGGVGPELSEIGLFYPWYIKEAIVWPQGNLPSSTMPNFKLDTEEVEDLMTFLMAQRNENKAVSEFARVVHVKEWESGQKMPWEKPVPPEKVHDVKNGMTIFATEGCAACHRLKGYDSQVGFRIEKGDVSFEELFAERRWFANRIPDDIAGSVLVKKLEKYADEINARISDDVRPPGLIEEIETSFPRQIEALYTNFKYASRAKNKFYHDAADQAQSVEERDAAMADLQAWKDLVHRVLMVYIQEYGLGRHIGPNLHWSGVYRDTEWLVGHFRNPGSHTAKSIMPVLAFDDTKFYALTHMLQVVGQRNRDQVRKVWDSRGFDPELAYEWHCADCHGQYLSGNGPIADWIYPIPKNLRNATFLRNLTKERAIQSIVHGVLGGPMPPWGETPEVNGVSPGAPVLNKDEITQLVNWLYQGLPGSRVIKGEEDVGKWQYDPEDVLRELEEEGNLPRLKDSLKPKEERLQGDAAELERAVAAVEPDVRGYYAALDPKLMVSLSASDLFDEVDSPFSSSPEQKFYYVKRKYFTPENIAAGERLFVANCAHCHGREGGGNGDRAITMEDAKPRMLSNLPWLRTRDDLRILRSLKYGVAGTSMTPWGDKTDTLQRIQLVTFIRSLTDERKDREDLLSALFQAFERSQLLIEEVRATESQRLAQAQRDYDSAVKERERLLVEVKAGGGDSKAATDAYSRELEILRELQDSSKVDLALKGLVDELKAESDIYEKLGRSIVAKGVDQEIIARFLGAVEANQGRYQLVDGSLSLSDASKQERLVESKSLYVLEGLEERIKVLEEEKESAQGQLRSAQRSERLTELNERLSGVLELRSKLITMIEEAKRSRSRQRDLFGDFSSKNDTADEEQ